MEANTLIFCAPADDTRLLKADDYQVRLHRDGAVVYSRHGKDAIIDRGDSIEVRDPYADNDFNTGTAVDMVGWKSRERVVFSKEEGEFPYAVGDAVARHNFNFPDSLIVPGDQGQYDYTLNVYNQLRAEQYRQQTHGSEYVERWRDDDEYRPPAGSSFKP